MALLKACTEKGLGGGVCAPCSSNACSIRANWIVLFYNISQLDFEKFPAGFDSTIGAVLPSKVKLWLTVIMAKILVSPAVPGQ